MAGDRVTFRCKDYRHGEEKQTMTLGAVQFLRRFLLHVLPKGFMRIRHYGFLANRCRKVKLERCRELLAATEVAREKNARSRSGDRIVLAGFTMSPLQSGISPVASQCAQSGARLSDARLSYFAISAGVSRLRQRPFVPL